MFKCDECGNVFFKAERINCIGADGYKTHYYGCPECGNAYFEEEPE